MGTTRKVKCGNCGEPLGAAQDSDPCPNCGSTDKETELVAHDSVHLQDAVTTTLVEHIVQYAKDNPVRLGLEITGLFVFGALGFVIGPVVGIALGVLTALLVYYKKPDKYLIELWQRWQGRG